MNYGFVIDNRHCIGCHACTVACKSEHDVPLGVNRTHVKYVEKGTFPNNRRLFSVHRCNHCEAAPCVDICPTSALYTRPDGIVDFDNERCIGCKSCMQACPYDALYIDPETHTAAKCNYCAHRLDNGYEPACVIICPTEAIVSGDLDDPNSKIAQLVAREAVTVRKPEKNTRPNVYYIDGDQSALDPTMNPRAAEYIFSSQATGVGHFSHLAEEPRGLSDDKLLLQMAVQAHKDAGTHPDQRAVDKVMKEMEDSEKQASERVYDVPSKGILWGWEVAGYIWTKAIATGAFMLVYLYQWLGGALPEAVEQAALAVSLVFITLTLVLLVMDLDRPGRFIYVLLRPNWKSWLTRGGYIVTLFSGLVSLMLLNSVFDLWQTPLWLVVAGFILAALSAVYTAFLLAQAKGRDLWQSASGSIHMLAHAVVAGAAVLMIIGPDLAPDLVDYLVIGLLIHLGVIILEVFTPHVSTDTARAIKIMTRGPLRNIFYLGTVGGGLMPLLLIMWGGGVMVIPAAILALIGILLTNMAWIKAPQMLPLS